MERVYKAFYSNVYRKWYVFNTVTQTISHYEDTQIKAVFCADRFNREVKQGIRV